MIYEKSIDDNKPPLLLFATDAQLSSSQDLRESLAPTGKLRASLYLGGPTNVIVHPTTGEMKGVGYEITRN